MLTYTAIRAQARNLVLDTDSAIDNDSFELIFGDVYNWWQTRKRDRVTIGNGTAVGLSVAADGYSMLTTAGVIQKLLALHRESANNVTLGTPMRWVKPAKLYWLRRRSTTSGVPTYWTAWLEEGTADWRVLIHPPADGTYHFSAEYEQIASDLENDTELADVSPGEMYVLGRLCAYEMAYILGRDEREGFMEGLLAPLEDEIKTAFAVEARQPRGQVGVI